MKHIHDHWFHWFLINCTLIESLSCWSIPRSNTDIRIILKHFWMIEKFIQIAEHNWIAYEAHSAFQACFLERKEKSIAQSCNSLKTNITTSINNVKPELCWPECATRTQMDTIRWNRMRRIVFLIVWNEGYMFCRLAS